jgi:HSP20 family protein
MKSIVSRDWNFLEDFFDGSPFYRNQESQKMDIYEDDEWLTVEVDTPAYEPEELKVNISGRVLYISGSKHKEEENKRYKIRERISSTFSKRVLLDFVANEEDVEAEVRNGVLKVKIPKKQEKKEGKKIEIKKLT